MTVTKQYLCQKIKYVPGLEASSHWCQQLLPGKAVEHLRTIQLVLPARDSPIACSPDKDGDIQRFVQSAWVGCVTPDNMSQKLCFELETR